MDFLLCRRYVVPGLVVIETERAATQRKVNIKEVKHRPGNAAGTVGQCLEALGGNAERKLQILLAKS